MVVNMTQTPIIPRLSKDACFAVRLTYPEKVSYFVNFVSFVVSPSFFPRCG
jgi:hypothetical protein